MKGWRTLVFNAAVIAVVAVAHWAVGVDWGQYVSPTVATVIVGMVNIVLRILTDTPVGVK